MVKVKSKVEVLDEEIIFLEVILPLPLPKTFTYSIQSSNYEEVEVGIRVAVPFGKNKVYCGLVKSIKYASNVQYEVKPILAVLDDEAVVEKLHIDFWQWIADYYMCHLGEVMNAALPSAFKLSSETVLIVKDKLKNSHLNVEEFEQSLIEYLSTKQKVKLTELVKKFKVKQTLKTVEYLMLNDFLEVFEEIKERFIPKTITEIELSEFYSTDSQHLKELMDELDKKEKQMEVLLSYLTLEKSEKKVNKKKLFSLKISKSSYNTLKSKGVFVEKVIVVSRFENQNEEIEAVPSLSEEQSNALQNIDNLFAEKSVVLLYGVTSSGKTLVYQKLIEQYLYQKKGQILFLVPEIALTTQLIQRIKKNISAKVAVYHSAMTSDERVEIWKGIKNGTFEMVIGARSAVFLPFKKLGLIVIDEEHEASFKQQEPNPRYHGRDASIYLAHLHQAKVLMGSATPSVESFYHAQKGKYGFVQLTKRYSEVALPEFEVINFNKTPLTERRSYLFEESMIEEINQRVQNGEQVILFQNKRGFVPIVICKKCGFYPKCDRCDVSMTFHSYEQRLICHYCNIKKDLEAICPCCGSIDWEFKGIGTQKIEEEACKIFPNFRISRLDSDSVRGKHSVQKILNQMEDKQLDILIGTQMIAKGLDFSEVSLIGVVCADHVWQFSDFRAAERAFQLLSQVGGRAGRRNKQGKVMMQAFDVNNHILAKVQSHDYQALYTEEIRERKEFNYPPFCSLIQLVMKNRDKSLLDKQSNELFHQFQNLFNDWVLPPAEPSVSKVKNMYIRYIFIKLPRNSKLLEKAKIGIKNTLQNFIIKENAKGLHYFYNVDTA